jgi:hypothetical protein
MPQRAGRGGEGMSTTAIALPRISREVLDEIEAELESEAFKPKPADFVKEQPLLSAYVVASCDGHAHAATMFTAMELLYEALKRQMRRGQ